MLKPFLNQTLLKVWSMTEVIPKKDFIDKIRKQNYCIRESSKINEPTKGLHEDYWEKA
jgi:hypothetical protein